MRQKARTAAAQGHSPPEGRGQSAGDAVAHAQQAHGTARPIVQASTSVAHHLPLAHHGGGIASVAPRAQLLADADVVGKARKIVVGELLRAG